MGTIKKFTLILVLSVILVSSSGLAGFRFSGVNADSNSTLTSTESLVSESNNDNRATSNDDGVKSPEEPKTSPEKVNHPPKADAGKDLVVNEGNVVKLDGSRSSDPDGDKLTYEWKQVSPKKPVVELSDKNAIETTFTAPSNEKNKIILTYALTVSDGKLQGSDVVKVVVKNVESPSQPLSLNLQGQGSVKAKNLNQENQRQVNNITKQAMLNLNTNGQIKGKTSAVLTTSTKKPKLKILSAQSEIGNNDGFFSASIHQASPSINDPNLGYDIIFTLSGPLKYPDSSGNSLVATGTWQVSCQTFYYSYPPPDFQRVTLPNSFQYTGTAQAGGSTTEPFMDTREAYLLVTDDYFQGYMQLGTDKGSCDAGGPYELNRFPFYWMPVEKKSNGDLESIGSADLTDSPCVCEKQMNWDILVHPHSSLNHPPIANAGPDQDVKSGDSVTLDGTGSSDPDGNAIVTYQWTQTAGPTVTLSDPNSAKPTFTAPDVSDDTTLTFDLVVNDGQLNSQPDEVNVNIKSGDFSFTCPDSLKIARGKSADASCSVTSVSGFHNPVSFDCQAVSEPTITCSLSPNPVTPPRDGQAPMILTVNTLLTTPIGKHDISISGTSGTKQHTIGVKIDCGTCAAPRTRSQSVSDNGLMFIGGHEKSAKILANTCDRQITTSCKVTGDDYGLYEDSLRQCTVGIGHLVDQKTARPCSKTDIQDYNNKFPQGMTRTQAITLEVSDAAVKSDIVNKALKVDISQEQFDALVDLAFNVSPVSFSHRLDTYPLIRDINNGMCDPDTILNDFLKFKGDPSRHKEQANLFNNGVYKFSPY